MVGKRSDQARLAATKESTRSLYRLVDRPLARLFRSGGCIAVTLSDPQRRYRRDIKTFDGLEVRNRRAVFTRHQRD